jgi:hypothetical protein
VSFSSENSSDAQPASTAGPTPADRPEVAIGIAFAGGFVIAQILKRLAR